MEGQFQMLPQLNVMLIERLMRWPFLLELCPKGHDHDYLWLPQWEIITANQ